MCGRFVQHADPEIYVGRYHVDDVASIDRSGSGFNVAPTQHVLAIRAADAGRQLLSLRWGLVPHWSNGPDNRYTMINARAETVHEKPAYRSAFKHRRCLIPAEGFYEWRATEHGKQPYLIRREDSAPFTMAGLWETWHPDDDHAPIRSCTIIVTDANSLMAPIHDRMPVVLREEDHDAWLARDNADADALRAMLQPPPADGWTLQPVSKAVNNPRNDSADLLQSIDLAADG